MEDLIERISKILKLDGREVKRRILYLNLTEKERNILKELSKKVSEKDFASLFKSFYEHLLKFEETRNILTKEGNLINRLKSKQIKYFRELLYADYDLNYAISRLKVGLIHEKLGVEIKYYVGAFSKWLEAMLPIIQKYIPEEEVPYALVALFKAILFDVSLSIDAYHFSKIIKGGGARYRSILNAVPDAVIVVDLETGRIVDANKTACELLGVCEEELIGKELSEVINEDLRPILEMFLKKTTHLLEYFSDSVALKNERTGERIPVEVHGKIFDLDGKKLFIGVFRDVREKLKREKELLRLNQLYSTLSEINILVTTVKDKDTLFNDAVKILGERGKFKYSGIIDLTKGKIVAEYGRCSQEDITVCIKMEEVQGERYALVISRTPKEPFTDQELNLLYEIAHDLSFGLTKIKSEERILKEALYDKITGLPNRSYFLIKLKEYYERAKAEKMDLAVVLIDVDKFSEINESLGHKAGDSLLRKIADRLKLHVRNRDDFLGRTGADEFGVIVYSDNGYLAASKLIERVKEIFKEPITVNSTDLLITFSYGISVYPYDTESYMELMPNAATALQKAKEYGGNKEVFFSSEIKKATRETVELRTQLRKAIEEKEFLLYYQPKINLKNGKVEGAEALIRWIKDGKVIPPYKFIPIIEKGDLIHKVGKWVIEEACRQVKEWKEIGIELPIAVNISPVQLKNPDFLKEFINSLKFCEENRRIIEVEITETTAMEDVEKSIELINTLKGFGIKTYIDDFGTGYTSLAYLKKLPVYALKIDIEFIRDLPQDRDDLEIVRAIISLAKTFGFKTVAEGVETKEQAELLKELGCDYAQGYYYAKPMPPDEFARFVKNYRIK
ncbi:MAG: hypothetical protein DSY32_02065 [Aquifex sp.]|nr:MAG: hypothetical protein DSY32_02065 [Aquifex sp.]